MNRVSGRTSGRRFSLLAVLGSVVLLACPAPCDIHPEMSAMIVAIATPLYAIADSHDLFLLRGFRG